MLEVIEAVAFCLHFTWIISLHLFSHAVLHKCDTFWHVEVELGLGQNCFAYNESL